MDLTLKCKKIHEIKNYKFKAVNSNKNFRKYEIFNV